MTDVSPYRSSRSIAVFVVAGVIIGGSLAGFSALNLPQPLRIEVQSVAPDIRWSPDCHPSECAAIVVAFTGEKTLNPRDLKVTLTALNTSHVINGTTGNPLGFYFDGAVTSPCELWASSTPGNATYPPGGRYVDPGGQIVEFAGASVLFSGFSLEFIGFYSGAVQPYTLTLDYQGAEATALVAVT